MKKIMIIGPGGSGKSTLAVKLGSITNIPLYHLDALFWRPGWVPTPNDEWDEIQRELVKKDTWIIDGNYGRTMGIRMSAADTIIFFDLPRWVPVYRAMKRRIQYHGKTRPDLTEGCNEKIDWQFLKWIWNYKRTRRPTILDQLKKHSDTKTTVVLRTRGDVSRFIEQIQNGQEIKSNL